MNTPFFMKEHFINVKLTRYQHEIAVVAIFSEAAYSFYNLFNQILKTFNHSPIYFFNVF